MTDQERPETSLYCFHGGYERAVDVKGRFNLPFRFRRSGAAHGDERYVVSEGPDGTLNLLPYDEFVAAFNRMRRRQPGPDLRSEMRRLSNNSRVLEPDTQGRVAVDPELLKRIGIEKRVRVVGMGNYLELWDPERFAAAEAQLAAPDQEFLSEFYG